MIVPRGPNWDRDLVVIYFGETHSRRVASVCSLTEQGGSKCKGEQIKQLDPAQ